MSMIFVLCLLALSSRPVFKWEEYHGTEGCKFCNTTHMMEMSKKDRSRSISEQTHIYLTNPQTEGNHNPSFLKGPDILLYEDFGSYELGQLWATAIDDHNGNDHQEVHFELTNNNEQLFDIQPHINVCSPGCRCQCPNRQPGVIDCGVAPHCGCGQGCGAAACGTNFPASCPLLGTGTLNFSIAANRFGIATVEVVGIDDGIADEICNGPVVPACTIIPCARIPCTHTSVVEFKITVLPVNDMPDFKHIGDVSSPEDSEWCVTRWAYDITAGAWGEEYGQPDGQILTWKLTNNNPNLFQTEPYLRYVQGDEWADLCYKPKKDKVGVATVEVWLSDSGGTQNGGINERNPNPEVFTITIYEQNDPPSFVAGSNKIIVTEDDPPYNHPWATNIKPGPESEETSRQQLDRFELEFTDSANLLKFDSPPEIDVDTGFLRFTLAPNANTFNDKIEISVVLWDNPRLIDCQMCTPLRSLAPHPTFTIEIIPVNDRPTFSPIENDLRFINVSEDSSEYAIQLVHGLCVGGLFPDCILQEGDPHAEAQESLFWLEFDNRGLLGTNAEIDKVAFSHIDVNPTGLLTFTPMPDFYGEVRATLHLKDTGGETPLDTSLNTTNITIIVHQVNDVPFYNYTLMPDVVSCLEDVGFFIYPKFILDLRAGPPNEENQLLSFEIRVGHEELFAEQPVIIPRYHDNARLHGDLEFRTAKDAFGDTTVQFIMYDDGGPYPGNSTDPKEFAIHIEPQNDPPSFTVSTSHLSFYEDSGNEGETRYHVSQFIAMATAGAGEDETQALEYRVVPTTSKSNVFLDGQLPEINHYGSLSFQVPHSWHGDLHLRITAKDIIRSTGSELTDAFETEPQDITISILPVNDPPTYDLTQFLIKVPPCESTVSCQHIYSNFITNVGPGFMEESQEVTVNAAIVYSEKSGSLEGDPELINHNNGNYSIRITVKAGAVAELHLVALTFKDNGGTLDGGHDTSIVNITVTVTRDALTPPPSVPASVAITQQPSQPSPGAPVSGPTFEIRNPSGNPLLVSYVSATLAVRNSKFQIDVAGVEGLEPFFPVSETDLRSIFSWPFIGISTPGEYYFEFELTLTTGEVLKSTTKTVSVESIPAVTATFPDSLISSGYPSEKDIIKGLSVVISSGQYRFHPVADVDNLAVVLIQPDNVPMSISTATTSGTRRELIVKLEPLPNYDMAGVDKILSLSLFSSAFNMEADRRGSVLQGTSISVQLTYPIISTSVITLERGPSPGQLLLTLTLEGIDIQPCCTDQVCTSSCCSLCFERSPVTGYLPQVRALLNYTASGRSAVETFVTGADLTSSGDIVVSVDEAGHADHMSKNNIEGEYLEIMPTDVQLLTLRQTEPIVPSDSSLRRVSFGIVTDNVNDTLSTESPPLEVRSFPHHPRLVDVLMIIGLLAAVLLFETSFLSLVDISLSHVLISTSHIPEYGSVSGFFSASFFESGAAVFIVFLFAIIHFAIHSFTRPFHTYFPSVSMSVCAFFLPLAIGSVFRTRDIDRSVIHTVVISILLAVEVGVTCYLLRKYILLHYFTVKSAEENRDFENYDSPTKLSPEGGFVGKKQPFYIRSFISGIAFNPDRSIVKYWQVVEFMRAVALSGLLSGSVSGAARGALLLLCFLVVAVHGVSSFYFKPYCHIGILVSKIVWDVLFAISVLALGIPHLMDSHSWNPAGDLFVIFGALTILAAIVTMLLTRFYWIDPYKTPSKEEEPRQMVALSKFEDTTTSNPIQAEFGFSSSQQQSSSDSMSSIDMHCAACKIQLDGNPMFCHNCGHKAHSKE
eukprot:TRINITY_DN7049_c0_g4_i1.p1 TRINITY_DN7049_c0_g4~~TRINITY_DN7049_c0_g4_i1.p1  ORF type:complete len:1797 (+),score=241.13 TRINITY_DN7049_c0_g4_i1:37-5391(+)